MRRETRTGNGCLVFDVISVKFSDLNLTGEFYQFKKTLINNQKKKYSVAEKYAKWRVKNISSFPLIKNVADLCPTLLWQSMHINGYY